MKTLKLALLLALALLMISCSTGIQEDAVSPNVPKGDALQQFLAQTDWSLNSCPGNTFINLNGMNECQYLEQLYFTNFGVAIRHLGQQSITHHHVCSIDGTEMTVSIQDCNNTTWKPLFKWQILEIEGSDLIMNVTFPEIAPGVKQTLTYKQTG